MKITLSFLCKYWKHILAVLLTVIYIGKTQYDYAVLYKMYMDSFTAHEEQIEKLNNIHMQSLRNKNKALQEYHDKLTKLEDEYKKKTEKVIIINKETEKKYKKKFNDNPKEIIDDIESKFGFKHAE